MSAKPQAAGTETRESALGMIHRGLSSLDAPRCRGAAPMLEERTTAPVLRGTHLIRCFGEGEMKATALNNVSLELHAGQIALLMGPSGSGKSTLLAVLSGLLHPDSGQVLALNQDLWAMSETQRERFRLKHCG